MPDDQFTIEWVDHGREPKNPPNPAYPNGIDVDGTRSSTEQWCEVLLPYPAKRCGVYIVECSKCGIVVGCTTAGRPDDPRSFKFNCKVKSNGSYPGRQHQKESNEDT